LVDTDEQLEIITKGVDEIVDTDTLRDKINSNIPLKIKFGMDPTAPDIHLGHTVALRKLKQFQDLGHKIIIIIGDFTAAIGDPSGKSQTRKLLSKEEILKNAETYKAQIFKILDINKTKIVFNSEWLGKLNFADAINLASKCTVAKMLEREDFKSRYVNHESIGLHEFLYPLIQGYDSIHLQSDVELGGTDQKFNILMGRTLQKDYGLPQQVAILMPLLEGTDGVKKMSKSLGNYVGIYESANDIFGKLMSIPDILIIRYFNLITDIHPKEIKSISDGIDSGSLNPMDAKMHLAHEVVKLYYDENQAKYAKDYFVVKFRNREIPEDISDFKIPDSVFVDSQNDSETKVVNMIKLLVESKICPSNSEARRLVNQGAVKLGIERISEFECKIKYGDILRVGKLKILRIVY